MYIYKYIYIYIFTYIHILSLPWYPTALKTTQREWTINKIIYCNAKGLVLKFGKQRQS